MTYQETHWPLRKVWWTRRHHVSITANQLSAHTGQWRGLVVWVWPQDDQWSVAHTQQHGADGRGWRKMEGGWRWVGVGGRSRKVFKRILALIWVNVSSEATAQTDRFSALTHWSQLHPKRRPISCATGERPFLVVKTCSTPFSLEKEVLAGGGGVTGGEWGDGGGEGRSQEVREMATYVGEDRDRQRDTERERELELELENFILQGL